MSPYFRRVIRELKESGVPGSSLDPSAPGLSHIMSSNSQKSPQDNLPSLKEIVGMKTVKAALHIYFFRSVSNLYTPGVHNTNCYLHLYQIIWRNHVHYANIYDKFFESVKAIVRLYCDPKYLYPIPSSRSLTPPSHHISGE